MSRARSSWLRHMGIVAWWIAFATISYCVSILSLVARQKNILSPNHLIWHGSWLLWCGLSFIAIYLARRFPIDNKRLARSLAIQALLGILFVSASLSLEFALNFPLRDWLDLREPGLERFESIFKYKFDISITIYWSIVGATNAFDYYVKYRKTANTASALEAKLAQSELQSLKMQIQPHFLFNTHHSIIALMLKKKNDEAIAMLTQLSDLLRCTLDKNNQQLASLREEMETLELYLGIQRVRFEDRLQIEIDLQPETLDAEVPYLCLQPIVENAIRHGMDERSSKSLLSIRSRLVDGMLELLVQDDGPGFNPSQETKGIGLKNTLARLEQLYDAENPLSIESSADAGTTVQIRIPFRIAYAPNAPS